jgi:hypothetical protein
VSLGRKATGLEVKPLPAIRQAVWEDSQVATFENFRRARMPVVIV